MPVDISYENKNKQIKFMASVQGNSIFSVPLAVAYHTRLFVKPAGFGYDVLIGSFLIVNFVALFLIRFVCITI